MPIQNVQDNANQAKLQSEEMQGEKQGKKEEKGEVAECMESMDPKEIVDALFTIDEQKRLEILSLIVEKINSLQNEIMPETQGAAKETQTAAKQPEAEQEQQRGQGRQKRARGNEEDKGEFFASMFLA